MSLESTEPDVRRKAAFGIANRDYARSPLKPDELDALVKYPGDADEQVRIDILTGLAKAKQTSRIIPLLVEGITSPTEKVRWASIEGLSVAGPGVADHIPAIVAALDKATTERPKCYLLLALGEAGKDAKPALPTLFARLKDKEDAIRLFAVRALLKAGAADPAEAVKQVRPLLNDSKPTRIAAGSPCGSVSGRTWA